MTRRCPDCDEVRDPRTLRQSGREFCPACGLILDGGRRPDAPLYARAGLKYSALGGGV
jgi:uncharacterized paraquat-inducible protein A